MKVSCFIPSFNKHEYVGDAITSVLNQTYQDWELWILENSNDETTRKGVLDYVSRWKNDSDKKIRYVEIDYTDEERKAQYPTALLLNEYYPQASGDLIFYLSDDDIFYPNAFAEVVNFFEARPEMQVIYFSQKTMTIQEDGSFLETNKIEANKARGLHTNEGLDCQVDGGQVVHRKHCLDFVEQPYFEPNYGHASHCDGLFLEKLGRIFTFEALNHMLGEHRVTRKSTWTR